MNRVLSVIAFLMLSLSMHAQISMDVHSHVISPEYRAFIEQHGATMEEGFPLPAWDVNEQLQFMEKIGIETSVLTMCAPLPYFGDAKESARLCRQQNEYFAKLKKQYPGKFRFCAALPLPDVKTAIREAVYALDALHADGIKLATNARGQYLGTPELDTLMQVLNERNAVIILHPHKPEPYNHEVMMQSPLAMQEYLAETTRAVTNMITRNVLARYSNLKVIVPHCGAYLPLAVPRAKSLTPVMQQTKMIGTIDWEANLRNLYYDLAGAHSPEVIKMMLTITTPDHILYGSDYPYVKEPVLVAGVKRMQEYLSKDPELAPYKQMFLYYNAKKLFK